MTGFVLHPMRSATLPLLVGREREQAALRQAWAAAQEGQGSLVLIAGEAGVGKTALANVLVREAEATGVHPLIGRCYDPGLPPPYSLWVDLFRRYPTDALAAPPPAPFARGNDLSAIDEPAVLAAQLHAWLIALSAREPLLIVLEDLHWADAASLDLLRVLTHALSVMPVLVLATYRESELDRAHPLYLLLPRLVREAHPARIALRPLTETDIAALARQRYDLPDADVARLATYLIGRAEGNALYTLELLHTLEETAALRRTASGWDLGDLTAIPVPALLRQMIDARVRRLGEPAYTLLETASAIGQDVPLAWWTQAGGADENTVLAVAERAIAAAILAQGSERNAVRFVHALTREAIYAGLPLLRRRAIHARIAETLMARTDADPGAVAHHLGAAGDARAATWYERAGMRAYRAYAWETAAAQFEEALAILERTGVRAGERALWLLRLARLHRYDAPRRAVRYVDAAIALAAEQGDPVQEAFLRYQRGLLRCAAGEVRSGVREASEAFDALRARPAAEIAARVAAVTGQTAARGGVLGVETGAAQGGALMASMAYAGDYAAVLARAAEWAEAPEPATSTGASGFGDGWLALGAAWAAAGQVPHAEAAFARALARYRDAAHHHQIAETLRQRLLTVTLPYHTERQDERARLLAELHAAAKRIDGPAGARLSVLPQVMVDLLEGRWERAATALATLPVDETPAHDGELAAARAWLAQTRGERAEAWAQVFAALPEGAATAPGDVMFLVGLACQRIAAALALENGDTKTTRQWLDAHDRWLAGSGAMRERAEGHLAWAAYYARSGDAARAMQEATNALALASEPRQPLALLGAHRLMGELLTAARRYDEARTHLNAALALADACTAPYERALTLIARAALRGTLGDDTGAAADRDEARDLCTGLGARPALARIESRAAAPTTARDTTLGVGLTEREYEVLALLARGGTNASIARALSLSPRTAERHIANIYAKIGAHSRTEALTFALRVGLGADP